MWRLTNEELDVYGDKPDVFGRWDILIHVGNYVTDIVGCIAVGLTGDEKNVWDSKDAIRKLRELLGSDSYDLRIEPKGAKNE